MLSRPWGGQKPCVFTHFLPTQCGPWPPRAPLATLAAPGVAKNLAFLHVFGQPSADHGPQGAHDPPWPPLGWPKAMCFYAFLATPVRPMGPKSALGHLGRSRGDPKPCVFTHFWPPQCGPWAPRVPLATLAAPGVTQNLVFLRIFGHPSAAHGLCFGHFDPPNGSWALGAKNCHGSNQKCSPGTLFGGPTFLENLPLYTNPVHTKTQTPYTHTHKHTHRFASVRIHTYTHTHQELIRRHI